MITTEITESTVLMALLKCPSKIKMHDLFDLIPGDGVPQESAIVFIKTLNQLLEMELVLTSQDSDGLVYWSISEDGKSYLYNYLNP